MKKNRLEELIFVSRILKMFSWSYFFSTQTYKYIHTHSLTHTHKNINPVHHTKPIRDAKAVGGARAGDLRDAGRAKRAIFPRGRGRPSRISLRGRTFQFGTLFARRISHVRAKSPLHDENLSSKYRQIGPDLSRHPQGQVEPGSADPHRAAVHSSAALRAKSRRPIGQ